MQNPVETEESRSAPGGAMTRRKNPEKPARNQHA